MSKKSREKKNPRGPKPTKRRAVILALKEKKRATSADLAVTTAYLSTLVDRGIIHVVGERRKEGKGRPANVYALTSSGRGHALNLTKKVII